MTLEAYIAFPIHYSALYKCPTLRSRHPLDRLAHALVMEGTNTHTETLFMEMAYQILADFVVTLDGFSLHIAQGTPIRITMRTPMTVTNTASVGE